MKYYMLFSNKSVNFLPPLLLHDKIITQTNQHTLLGITFDETMTFKPHILNLQLKLSRLVPLLYLVKDNMPPYILITLYNDHILPHFHYCTPIWCNTYPTHLLPLLRLQKRIIRIVTASNFFAHTQPLFRKTNTLTLFDINKLQIGIHMYKLLQTNDATLTLQAEHNYPTRSHANLRTPLHNTTLFQHSMSYSGPLVWNSIPKEIKSLNTLRSFKKHLKSYIINKYSI